MASTFDEDEIFTVQVTLKVPESRQDEVLQAARCHLPIFARQPGFLTARIYCSHDGTRVLTCLHWASQSDYETCMQSPEWAQCDPQLFVLLDRGTIQMDVRTYFPVCAQEPATV